ncbi:hypothetical protein V2G26_020515 [Clonostachys chloroleuca]
MAASQPRREAPYFCQVLPIEMGSAVRIGKILTAQPLSLIYTHGIRHDSLANATPNDIHLHRLSQTVRSATLPRRNQIRALLSVRPIPSFPPIVLQGTQP